MSRNSYGAQCTRVIFHSINFSAKDLFARDQNLVVGVSVSHWQRLIFSYISISDFSLSSMWCRKRTVLFNIPDIELG